MDPPEARERQKAQAILLQGRIREGHIEHLTEENLTWQAVWGGIVACCCPMFDDARGPVGML